MKFLCGTAALVLVGCLGCNAKDTDTLSKDASTLAQHAATAANTAQLTGRVWMILSQRKDLEVQGIHVESKDGVVTLSGHVANETMKKLAQDTAFSIRGVDKVVNDLKVDPAAK